MERWRKPGTSRGPASPFGERQRRPGRGEKSVDRILETQPWDALTPHLLKAAAEPEASIEKLRVFARMLLEWNRGVSNLISRHDEPRILERHLLESLEPAAWLKSCNASNWIDLGSGGGLPAIPLAIAGVGERWTLVESRRPKTLFMRRAVEMLGLDAVTIEHARIESLVESQSFPGAFTGFTSRATLPLGPTLALAARLVAPGGFAFLWKGSRREQEMAEDRGWEGFWELDGLLGIGSGQTVVARFSRKEAFSE